MDSEQASLSTIIIDSNGNPIGQVIYRCALCRKICDSSTDAMLHYQMDHVELTKLQLQQQQQPVATSSGASMNQNARGHSLSNSSPHHHNHQHGTGNNRQQFSNTSTPYNSANSLLKRASSSTPNSLLKRSNNASPSASASSSLLKRANAMRCYQSGNAARTVNKRSNNPNLASPKSDTIHRQYITTSASRAAKRYTNAASGGRGSIGASNSTNESSSNVTDTSGAQQQVTKTNNSLKDSSSTSTSSKARSATPRHVQRTNQYTANLKAKINAQKSAASSNTTSSQKSTSTPNSSQPSSGDSTAPTEASSAISTNSNTTLQKVDIKTYSLRPRSLSRRSVRIS